MIWLPSSRFDVGRSRFGAPPPELPGETRPHTEPESRFRRKRRGRAERLHVREQRIVPAAGEIGGKDPAMVPFVTPTPFWQQAACTPPRTRPNPSAALRVSATNPLQVWASSTSRSIGNRASKSRLWRSAARRR